MNFDVILIKLESIIEITDLEKSYGNRKAVDGLSLKVLPGDIYGFLGPNGAGKSTTLRILLSLIKPDSGSVKLYGKNLASERRTVLQNIGCIIEKPDFYLYLSAIQNLEICARYSGYKPDKSRLLEMLDWVGLNGREKDPVQSYSHGMKQRLGLAQALIHEPKLILLDEPTTGLDPQGIIDLREMILRLKNELGKTVVLSSHILSEMELIATRLVVINKGKAIVEGYLKDLLSDQDMIVEWEADPVDKLKHFFITNFSSDKVVRETNSSIFIRMQKQDVNMVLKKLIDEQLTILSVVPRNSLEDKYMQILQS